MLFFPWINSISCTRDVYILRMRQWRRLLGKKKLLRCFRTVAGPGQNGPTRRKRVPRPGPSQNQGREVLVLCGGNVPPPIAGIGSVALSLFIFIRGAVVTFKHGRKLNFTYLLDTR
jgi:hypothetical protein